MPADSVYIRPLALVDSIQEITELLHAAYAQLASMGFRYLATHQDDKVTRDRLAKGYPLIAESVGRIVGTVTLYGPRENSPCQLYCQSGVFSFGQFGVLPAYQRHRIGSQLMAALEADAITRGATQLALDTAEGATHLIQWYERLGYRFIEYADWEVTNYRSVIMAKELHQES